MPSNRLDWGDWNACCDLCGFKFKASALRKDWQNLMLCEACWSPRHPQDFLRVRGDNPAVPWTRPESDDTFVSLCFIWGVSAYANLAEAGCAQAGNTPLTYLELYNMKYPVPPEDVPYLAQGALPGYAIPGESLPGTFVLGP